MQNWEQKIKEKTKSIGEMLKLKLMQFNDRSLLSKLALMAFIHYSLRIIMGGKSETKTTEK